FVHKKLKLNWSAQSVNNGSGASVANGAVANQQSNNSIFVGDLAPSVTEAQLFDLFINKYPSTVHAKVMYDQLTGISKGFGFVKFKSSMDQQRALVEMQGCFLNGRAIKIGIAGGNNNNNSNSNYNNQRMANDNISNGLGQQSRSLNGQLPQQFVNATPQQPVLNHFTDPNNTTVFVGGFQNMLSDIYQPEEQNLNGYDLLPGRENLNYVNVLPSRDLYAYNQIGNQPIVNNGMPNLSVTNDLSVNNTTAALERLNSGTASFSFV
ncbi:Protein NAM8, partial [Nakaseomyces glabratus]